MTTFVPNLRRELEKARIALVACQSHLGAHAESNAALHMAPTVMYSPLHAHVTAAIGQIDGALENSSGAAEQEQQNTGLAAVLADLDRCMHGRHEGDVCASCGGPSKGNHNMPTGRVIGYDIRGKTIVMPDREHKHDPGAWRRDA